MGERKKLKELYCCLLIRRPPRSTLVPYTTLVRSLPTGCDDQHVAAPKTTPAGTTAFARAVASLEEGHYEEAIDALFVIVGEDPENADIFHQLGYANSQLQNYDQALTFYHRALNIEPEHAGAHAYIGKVYLEIGDLTMAQHHLGQLDLICLRSEEHTSELQSRA